MKTVLILTVIIASIYAACPNSCSGRGDCNKDTNICKCVDGYTGPDCSLMTCPYGYSYTDLGDKGEVEEDKDSNNNDRMLEEEQTETAEEYDFANSTKVDKDITIKGFGKAGGILLCGKDNVDVIYYDRKTVIVRDHGNKEDDYYNNITWSSCRIMSKRNDLSMIKPLLFKDRKSSWIDESDLNHYGVTGGVFDLVCTVDNKDVKYSKDRNNSAIFIKATFNITNDEGKWVTKSDTTRIGVCYPLIGLDNRNIYITNSDVYNTLMYSDKGNYYFGVKPSEGVQVSLNKDLIDNDGELIKLPDELIPPSIQPYVVKGATLHLVFTPTTDCNGNCVVVNFYTEIISINDTEKFDDGEPTQEDDSTKTDRLLYERELKQVEGKVLTLDPKIPEYLISKEYSMDLIILKTRASPHSYVECSDNGVCDRSTGLCKCNEGFTGVACQILSNCPNNCNNYGRCVVIDKALGGNDEDLPGWAGLSTEKVLYGCICDAGHRGADCSLLECPSSVDPQGATNEWEYVESAGLMQPKEVEQRDCSGRGLCNYGTGTCTCFDGFKGTACEEMSLSLM